MAKNKSLPAHLQEKDSRGDDHLTLYERHEKPIVCRSRPSLSNPRSTMILLGPFHVRIRHRYGSPRIVSLQALLHTFIGNHTGKVFYVGG